MAQLSNCLAPYVDSEVPLKRSLKKMTDPQLLQLWQCALAANTMWRKDLYPTDSHKKEDFYRLANVRVLHQIQQEVSTRKYETILLIYGKPTTTRKYLSAAQKQNLAIYDKIFVQLTKKGRDYASYGHAETRAIDWMKHIAFMLLDDLNEQIGSKPLIRNPEVYAKLFLQYAQYTLKKDQRASQSKYTNLDFIDQEHLEHLQMLRADVKAFALRKTSTNSPNAQLAPLATAFKTQLEHFILHQSKNKEIIKESTVWTKQKIDIVLKNVNKTWSLEELKRYFLFSWRIVHFEYQQFIQGKLYYNPKRSAWIRNDMAFPALIWMLLVATELSFEAAEKYLAYYEEQTVLHLVPTLKLY